MNFDSYWSIPTEKLAKPGHIIQKFRVVFVGQTPGGKILV